MQNIQNMQKDETAEKKRELLRELPSMDKLLALDAVTPFESRIGREAVKSILTETLDEERQALLAGKTREVNRLRIERRALELLRERAASSLKRVINATGVVIHTNLGRSILADAATNAVREIASGYGTLEYSLKEGERGHRNAHVEWLLRQTTGAEAGIVVNNNAGAVVLALAALAKGREVIVSRGELVEIGGSFRIPEIMAFSGAELVEVGTTNRTRASDYERAITDQTAMLLKVHPSNYRIEGFCEQPGREELAELARRHGLVFMEDLGSGTLIDLAELAGLPGEPSVGDCIRKGVGLVTFSGDKLLGGPQIGCLVGQADLIEKLRKNPFARALRVDKMTLAAFDATLRLYLENRTREIPTLAMLAKETSALRSEAVALARRLRNFFAQREKNGKSALSARIVVVKTRDAVGGGAFPQTELPGWGVAFSIAQYGSAARLTRILRNGRYPVVTGIEADALVFHVRTLTPQDPKHICDAFADIFGLLDG